MRDISSFPTFQDLVYFILFGIFELRQVLRVCLDFILLDLIFENVFFRLFDFKNLCLYLCNKRLNIKIIILYHNAVY